MVHGFRKSLIRQHTCHYLRQRRKERLPVCLCQLLPFCVLWLVIITNTLQPHLPSAYAVCCQTEGLCQFPLLVLLWMTRYLPANGRAYHRAVGSYCTVTIGSFQFNLLLPLGLVLFSNWKTVVTVHYAGEEEPYYAVEDGVDIYSRYTDERATPALPFHPLYRLPFTYRGPLCLAVQERKKEGRTYAAAVPCGCCHYYHPSHLMPGAPAFVVLVAGAHVIVTLLLARSACGSSFTVMRSGLFHLPFVRCLRRLPWPDVVAVLLLTTDYPAWPDTYVLPVPAFCPFCRLLRLPIVPTHCSLEPTNVPSPILLPSCCAEPNNHSQHYCCSYL